MTDRKSRCRMRDHRANPCPNEQLSDYGMCAKHLAGAAAEFAALTAEAPKPLSRAVTPPRRETARLAG